jgi:hypothetical protein
VLVTGAQAAWARRPRWQLPRGGTAILLGRKTRPLEKLHDEAAALGAQPAIYPLDLEGATPRDYEDMAAAIERDFGRLDGIVNCAAHFSGLQPAGADRTLDWLRTLHVNLSAPFLLCRRAWSCCARRRTPVSCSWSRSRSRRQGKLGSLRCGQACPCRMVLDPAPGMGNRPCSRHALLPPPLRTALRRTAYFGENSMQLPPPDSMADALVYLLGADGVRGARARCWI